MYIRDYIRLVVIDNYPGITRQTKLALISMVQQNQFRRSSLEDPNVHLATFLEICDTRLVNTQLDYVCFILLEG